MYAREVPLYQTLLDVCAETNAAHPAGVGRAMQRIGAERHGAIRLGSMDEAALIGRLFALVGMFPVGLYDLRDTSQASLPIVATAFRPVDHTDMERSAFRMFTSVLVPSDRRFFDAQMAAEIERRVGRRTLLGPQLMERIQRAEARGGAPVADADVCVAECVDALRVDASPIDLDWNRALGAVSPVAADVAGAPSTHLNHLTPRVFDIDATADALTSRGVEMIERIQGPPRWDGPPVLLRQTSFRALDEKRHALDGSGSATMETVRVRFGEIEQRGVAPTPAGRAIIDRLIAEGRPLGDELPASLFELARQDLVHVAVERTADGRGRDPWNQIEAGAVQITPVTYEDFLPASATGIFASNLAHEGRRSPSGSTDRDAPRALANAVGGVADPADLAARRQRSAWNDVFLADR